MASLFAWTNIVKTASLVTTASTEPALPLSNIANDQGSASAGWQTQAGTLAATVTITPSARTTVRAAGVFRSNLTAAASLVVNAYQQPLDTSLDLNFLSGVLDSRITFTRASTATYFNAAGTLTTAGTNAARFDYDPITHVAKGLLIEEARTNSIRNSMMVGAASGTPGTLPTNWSAVVAIPSLPHAVVGSGTDAAGWPYIDLRFVGTASSTGSFILAFDSTIAASAGQAWTQSLYVRLVGGSLTGNLSGFTLQTNVNGVSTATAPFTLTTTTQRPAATVASTAGGTTTVQPYLAFGCASGVATDFTIRIGAPQLELGAFPTSYIPTTTVAVARAADVATIPTASWFNQSACTLIYDIDGLGSTSGGVTLGGFGSNNGFADCFYAAFSTNNVAVTSVSSGVGGGSTAYAAIAPNTLFRFAMGWSASQIFACMNGATPITGVGTATIQPLVRVAIGQAPWANGNTISGCVRRVRCFMRALSTAEQQLATATNLGLVGTATIAPVYGQAVAVFPTDLAVDYVTMTFSDAGNTDNHLNIPLCFLGPAWQPLSAMSWASTMGRDDVGDTVTTRGGQTYVDLRATTRRWEVALDGVRSTEAFTQLDAMDRYSRSGSNVLVVPNTAGDVMYEATFGILRATADVSYPLGVDTRRSWRARLTERL